MADVSIEMHPENVSNAMLWLNSCSVQLKCEKISKQNVQKSNVNLQKQSRMGVMSRKCAVICLE